MTTELKPASAFFKTRIITFDEEKNYKLVALDFHHPYALRKYPIIKKEKITLNNNNALILFIDSHSFFWHIVHREELLDHAYKNILGFMIADLDPILTIGYINWEVISRCSVAEWIKNKKIKWEKEDEEFERLRIEKLEKERSAS